MSALNPRPVGGPPRQFRLDKANGKIAGVCSGIGRYFNIDPLVVRLVFAIGAIAGFGTFVLLYLALWAFVD